MDNGQLRSIFIIPVIRTLAVTDVSSRFQQIASKEAEDLLDGTFAQESGCGKYVRELDSGPGRGFWQMNPRDHDEIWKMYLPNHAKLANAVLNLATCSKPPSADLLVDNIRYACAMARIHYLRIADKIPSTLEGQAAYWKKYYNSEKGAGTVEEYIANYKKYNGIVDANTASAAVVSIKKDKK
jgi:hypothetical protein